MTRELSCVQLRCRACSWTETCGPEGVVAWLRKARKVRPGREPELDIMLEVLRAAAGQLACPECGAVGLAAAAATNDDGDWPTAIVCVSCLEPIPKARLQAVPNATLCAACQREAELGKLKAEMEYCPQCGSAMELRPTHSHGITRYVPICTGNPPCRPKKRPREY